MRQTDRSGKARWGGLLTISFIMVMMLMLAFPMGRAFAARTDTITLWRGESYKMNALWPGKITWSSKNPRIATVDRNGMVKGVSSGTAVIQISNGTNTEQRTVRVNIPKLNKSGIKIKENSTFSLSLAGLRADWSSNNRKVAVVSNTGIVTGKNPGSCIITARYRGYNYTCKVTVIKDTTIKRLTLNKLAMTLREGKTAKLSLSVAPSKLQYLAKTAKWTSTNKKVATVSGGVVKAIDPGTCTITVKLQNITMACAVTVLNKYKITNAAELFDMDGETGNYYLAKDINISGSTKRLKAIRCDLNGNGHTIIVSDRSTLAAGNYGFIHNLKIRGGALTGTNFGTIQDCNVSGNITMTNKNQVTYSIALDNRGTIVRCDNTRSFNVVNTGLSADDASIGGIVFQNRGTIDSCANRSAIRTHRPAAGIAVINNGTISNCVNSASVNGKKGCGITLSNYGRLINCLNTGKVDYAFSAPGKDGIRLDCYYQTGMSSDKQPAQDDNTRIIAVTPGAVKSPVSFPTFDFALVWKMTKNGPTTR